MHTPTPFINVPTAQNGVDLGSLYLQLGIAGATLFILLVFVVLLFKFVTKDNSRINKLCDKIDCLVTSYSVTNNILNKVLISGDKDQKSVIKLLTDLMSCILDIQKNVTKIDIRTCHCIENKRFEEERGNSYD